MPSAKKNSKKSSHKKQAKPSVDLAAMHPEDLIEKAALVALNSRFHAHSPYSKVKVGAAVISTSGKIYPGCNVENSSYGGTICAERTAICSAVAAEGKKFEILAIVVATDASPPWPPCGICRQVIAEFGGPNTPIIDINPKGKKLKFRLKDLLPQAFTSKHLKK